MTTKEPGDGRLCAWCGGPVPPSRGSKPRRYCKDGCKQRAYEARKLEEQLRAVREAETEKRTALLARAYTKGREASSRDVAQVGPGTSRDDVRVPGDDWVRSPEAVDAQLAELERRRPRA